MENTLEAAKQNEAQQAKRRDLRFHSEVENLRKLFVQADANENGLVSAAMEITIAVAWQCIEIRHALQYVFGFS